MVRPPPARLVRVRKHLAPLSWMAAAAIFVGVPAGALLGLLLTEERLEAVDRKPAPFVQPARVVEFDDRTGVVARLRWQDGPTLYAPTWSGTVGAVWVEPGPVRSGDRIASIDGVVRLAVHTPQPFFRPLSSGDRGVDVVWLHDVLITFGYLAAAPTDNDRVGPVTRRAIAALAENLGVLEPVEVFDPAWFVWLPTEQLEVATVALRAGAPAPPAGTPVAAGAPELASVDLERVDGGPLTLESGTRYVLQIGDVTLSLDGTTGELDGKDLAKLSRVVAPATESASGSVRLAEPLTLWALPASAVMAGADGRLCVWIERGDAYEPMNVEVVGGRAGVAFVRPGATSAAILENPADILNEPACPSG